MERLPHRSGDAFRHCELYESDFDLAHLLGQNAHRFSLEWSRIEPEPGRWSERALAHYAAVVAALKRRGLEQIVTSLDYLARLAALVPRPRLHLTRDHGLFAPHSAKRANVNPAGPKGRPVVYRRFVMHRNPLPIGVAKCDFAAVDDTGRVGV